MDFLDRLLPISLLQNPRKIRRGRIVIGTAGILVITLASALALRLAIGFVAPVPLALALVSFAALASVPILLQRTGSLALAGWLTTCVFMVLVVSQIYWAGGPGSPVAFLLPLIPLLATHLVGLSTGRWTAAFLVAVIWLWVVIDRIGFELPRRRLSPSEDTMAFALLLSVAVVLVAVLAISYEQQRKVLEGELRQSDALYRRLFDQSKDMVALAKPSGRLIDVNQAGVELFGFASREAFLQADIRSLYVDPSQRFELLRRLQRDGFAKNYESLQVGPDGRRRVIQGTTTAVRNAAGEMTHFLGILRDVTRERAAARERERMMRELERKNRDLEQFTYTVSHDLKSPLFTLRGFLDLLVTDARSGDFSQILEDADQIVRTTERMQALVDDLLTLARVGSSQESWSPQSLKQVVDEVAELLAGRLSVQGIDVRVAEDLPKVYGDRALLRQLLQNLMDNAAKAVTGVPEPRIEIGRRLDGSTEVIFVRDNGRGIAPEDAERIFGLFSQVDAGDEGTGIGLAIVKKVVDLHGGLVWAESEGRGKGATFCFSMPVPSAETGPGGALSRESA